MKREKMAKTVSDLWKKEDVILDMQRKYGERSILVPTKKYSRSKTYIGWADEVVKTFFKLDRSLLEPRQCYFSYIKFAKNAKEETFAIVGALSQFHKGYTSDVRFYDINHNDRKDAAVFMKRNKLEWDESEILILLNEVKNSENVKMARDNEKCLQCRYNLFD